jgi:hydroxypyruvate isomerase
MNTNEKESGTDVLKGINHSVARWCFNDIDLDTLCMEAQNLESKELIWLAEWPILKNMV